MRRRGGEKDGVELLGMGEKARGERKRQDRGKGGWGLGGKEWDGWVERERGV